MKNILAILVFIIFEIIALTLYFSKDETTWAKNINTISHIHNFRNEITIYFSLRYHNEKLNSEIAKLRADIQQQSDLINTLSELHNADSIVGNYTSIAGTIINQTILKKDNIITINKGEKDGVELNMSIVSNGNIVGYVTDVAEDISTARSILNNKINSSGTLKKNNSLCSIKWTGESPYEVDFFEMTKYSDAAIGDTIITTSFSNIYIPNLNIGTITEIELVQNMYYDGKIKLFDNYKRLKYITIIGHKKDSIISTETER